MIGSFARHVLGAAAALCLGLVASSALAQAIDDDGTCPELAQKMSKIYFGFPEIVDGSIERFASWKASCAAKAPADREMSSLFVRASFKVKAMSSSGSRQPWKLKAAAMKSAIDHGARRQR